MCQPSASLVPAYASLVPALCQPSADLLGLVQPCARLHKAAQGLVQPCAALHKAAQVLKGRQ